MNDLADAKWHALKMMEGNFSLTVPLEKESDSHTCSLEWIYIYFFNIFIFIYNVSTFSDPFDCQITFLLCSAFPNISQVHAGRLICSKGVPLDFKETIF